MYEIVFIDLDGTLLDSSKELQNFNTEIIRALKDKVKIVITSGRNFGNILPILNKLDMLNKDNYTISLNGSCIVNNHTHEIVYGHPINPKDLQLLKDWLMPLNLSNVKLSTFKVNYNLDEKINEPVYKIVIRDKKEIIDEIKEKIPKEFYSTFEIYNSEFEVIDFLAKGVSKKCGVEKILDYYNIDKNDAVAFGDGGNDIEMIKYVGLGIAMENGFQNLKNVADLIADTNDNNGVGKMLIKLFNL